MEPDADAGAQVLRKMLVQGFQLDREEGVEVHGELMVHGGVVGVEAVTGHDETAL